MAQNNHGAFGSNQKLERVPVEEAPVKNEDNSEKEENAPVPTSSATEDDGDVVYLRDDLKPGNY